MVTAANADRPFHCWKKTFTTFQLNSMVTVETRAADVQSSQFRVMAVSDIPLRSRLWTNTTSFFNNNKLNKNIEAEIVRKIKTI